MSLEAAEQRGQAAASARVSGRSRAGAWTSSSTLTWLVFVVISAAAALLFFHETRGTTFSADEWLWVLHRRGSSLATFLRPHNGHFSLVPIAIYKLLFATAGLHDYEPYRAVVIAAHLACSTLVLIYARRRISNPLALFAAALILFLGPAAEDVLWPFQLAWLISIGTGLGALLLLDRRDKLGEAGACVLLAFSLASSGLGLPIALGAAIDVLARPDRRRRAWVVAAPLALYGLWSLVYQDASIAAHAIVLTPDFVAKLASATLSALMGLAGDTVPSRPGTLLTFGPTLLALGVAGLVWRARRVALSPRAAALIATTLLFWILVALGRAQFSTGYEARYLYLGAVLVVLLATELARGVGLPLRVTALAGLLVAAVVVSNLGAFRDEGRFLRSQSQRASADLGALEIGRQLVGPTYVAAHLPDWPLILLEAGPYFAAERAFGSPSASPAQISAAPEPARETADAELVSIHGVGLQPAAGTTLAGPPPSAEVLVGGALAARGACVSFRPLAFTPAPYTAELQVAIPPGGLRISARGGPVTVGVRRFGTGYQPLGTLAASASATIRIAADLARTPWHLRLMPSAASTVCGVG